ncbi:MAG: 50S ribosomal protein L6 [Candidatus Diapherotrites archaeon]|nr:50S ribosomal protein L6 [Candidatus Diapherotrites archaeon]
MKTEKEIIIELPSGVTGEIQDKKVTLTGNGKTVSKQFKATTIQLSIEGNKVKIYSAITNRKINAVMNAFDSHIKNLINGLKEEYVYKMEIVYSHFPMTVAIKGKEVEINNLAGAKSPRKAKIKGNTKVEVKGKDVTVKGNNKEETGQTAANIENATKIRGRDIRVFQDGIYITEKPTKAV